MTQEDCLEYSHQTINSAGDQISDDIGSKNISNVSQSISTTSDNVASQLESLSKLSDVAAEVQVQDKVPEVNEPTVVPSAEQTAANTPVNSESVVTGVSQKGQDPEMTVLTQSANSANIRDLEMKFEKTEETKKESSSVANDPPESRPTSSSRSSQRSLRKLKSRGDSEEFDDPIARLNALRADISKALKEVKEVIDKHVPKVEGAPERPTKEEPVPFKFVRKKPKRVLTFEEEEHIEVEVKPEDGATKSQETGNQQPPEVSETKNLAVSSNQIPKAAESAETKTSSQETASTEIRPIAAQQAEQIKHTETNVTTLIAENKEVGLEARTRPSSELTKVAQENVVQVNDRKTTSKEIEQTRDEIGSKHSAPHESTAPVLFTEGDKSKKDDATVTAPQFRPQEPSSESSQGKNEISSRTAEKTDVSILPTTATRPDQQPVPITTATTCDKESESIRRDDITLARGHSDAASVPTTDHSITAGEPVKADSQPSSEYSITETADGGGSNTADKMTKVPDPVKPVEPIVTVNNKKLIIEQSDPNNNTVPSENYSKLKNGSAKIANGLVVTNSLPEISNNVENKEATPKIDAISGDIPNISETIAKPEDQTQSEPTEIVPSSENKVSDDVSSGDDLSKSNESVIDSSETDQTVAETETSESSATAEEAGKPKRRKSKSSKKLKRKVVIKRLKRKLSKDSSTEDKVEEPENIEKEVEPIVDSESDEEPAIVLKPIIKQRTYDVGDLVMYADRIKKAIKWKKAVVVERITSISYKLEYEGQQKPAHISYIKKYTDKKVQFGGKEYLEIDYAKDEEEEEEKPYNIWARV